MAVYCLLLHDSNISTIDFASYSHYLNFKPKILGMDVGYGSSSEYASVWKVGVLP